MVETFKTSIRVLNKGVKKVVLLDASSYSRTLGSSSVFLLKRYLALL